MLRFTKRLSLHEELFPKRDLKSFYDGIQNPQRVDGFTQRDLATKVVDQFLNSPTVASRYIESGEQFEGKTMDITLSVSGNNQLQWIVGLETLNSSAINNTVTTSYAETCATLPVVSIGLESFANVGSLGIINLDVYNYENAAENLLTSLGSAIYNTGGNQMLTLEQIIDNGTNASTIGGVSRSTYSVLDSTVTAAASGKLTLAQMATLHDNVRAAGLTNEQPNAGYITKAEFSLYEQLLTPNVRVSYDQVGYNALATSEKHAETSKAKLENAAGFNVLWYRRTYMIDDDYALTGNMYFANERYIDYYGRYEIPEEYEDILERVGFGELEATDGTGAMALEEPSKFYGWFYQDALTIPDQFGRISRFYVIGQLICRSFRRQGKLTGITGV